MKQWKRWAWRAAAWGLVAVYTLLVGPYRLLLGSATGSSADDRPDPCLPGTAVPILDSPHVAQSDGASVHYNSEPPTSGPHAAFTAPPGISGYIQRTGARPAGRTCPRARARRDPIRLRGDRRGGCPAHASVEGLRRGYAPRAAAFPRARHCSDGVGSHRSLHRVRRAPRNRVRGAAAREVQPRLDGSGCLHITARSFEQMAATDPPNEPGCPLWRGCFPAHGGRSSA